MSVIPHRDTLQRWLTPFLLLGSVAVIWISLIIALDLYLSSAARLGFFQLVGSYSADEAQSALGNLPEVVVGLLGIVLTMVSFILQLAATRYTPRVTEMFFHDRTNLVVLGFFVVASIHSIWATLLLRRAFIPHFLVLTSMVMMTVTLLLLIPYFSYVFAFLSPSRIVSRLKDQALHEVLTFGRGAVTADRKIRVVEGLEQLADIAVNAIAQKDRTISSQCADALRELVVHYIREKPTLTPAWFDIDGALRRNPDFVAMTQESVNALSASHTWVEWKVLRQYENVVSESLNRTREVAHLVAINTRYVGEAALEHAETRVIALVTKFFNTYLRACINQRDVRSAYNILHQYRLFAEQLLRKNDAPRVIEVATYFKYYGQLANTNGLPFVNETAAYDLCALCELAHDLKFPLERQLLGILLEVDKVPENEQQEQSLRGVRKAQVKLATHYLVSGAEDLAREVFRDMEHERTERLQSIREEMLAVDKEDFWEVVDRGHNFDYLPDNRRQQLAVFYSWFAARS